MFPSDLRAKMEGARALFEAPFSSHPPSPVPQPHFFPLPRHLRAPAGNHEWINQMRVRGHS